MKIFLTIICLFFFSCAAKPKTSPPPKPENYVFNFYLDKSQAICNDRGYDLLSFNYNKITCYNESEPEDYELVLIEFMGSWVDERCIKDNQFNLNLGWDDLDCANEVR